MQNISTDSVYQSQFISIRAETCWTWQKLNCFLISCLHFHPQMWEKNPSIF